jgi:hypothetical protein
MAGNSNDKPLRVPTCCRVASNYFGLLPKKIRGVWQAYRAMLKRIDVMDGKKVLGIMADVKNFHTAAAVCDRYRTTPVGEYNVWRHRKIEARIGRAPKLLELT